MLHLKELAKQIRGKTVRLLEGTPNDWLLWAPSGTSNHIIWHVGHSIWVQDCLCIEPLCGSNELPPRWSEKFGMNCHPVAETRDWPDRVELQHLLETQLDRMLALFDEHSVRLNQIGSNQDDRWDLTRGVIHALHDEANHQGEIYLLRKLQQHSAEL